MIGPVSSTGRAMMASLQQAMSKGMPVDQAVAYVKSMAQQGVAPLADLYAMLNQVQRLKQPQAQMPQTPPTVRDQVAMAAQQRDMMGEQRMGAGLATLDTGAMEGAEYAGGGVVAFAGPEGSFVTMTPEQIALQKERQVIAEQLMRGPVSVTDPNYRPPDFVVDSKGRVVPKERVGEILRTLRKEKEGQGITSQVLEREGTKSPMKREVEAYRAGEKSSRVKLPEPDVTVDRETGRYIDRRAQGLGATPEATTRAGAAEAAETAATAAEAAPKASVASRARSLTGSALRGGIPLLLGESALETQGEFARLRELEKQTGQSRAVPQRPTGERSLSSVPLPGGRESSFRGIDDTSPQERADYRAAFLANIPLVGGLFSNPLEARTKELTATAAKPPAAPAPAAGQGTRGDRTGDRTGDTGGGAGGTRMGGDYGLGRIVADERKLLSEITKGLDDGSREEQEFQRLTAIAQRDKTGPYSELFSKSDQVLQQRMAEIQERKKTAFGRALVNAGVAMATQAAKGGQPGNELQKFLASAVAGIGGYSEAQQLLEKESDKAQREYDDLMLRVETAREGSRGELRGAARQRVGQLENRADQIRGNIQRIEVAKAQLETNRDIAGVRAAASAAGATNRARASVYELARKMVSDQMKANPALMMQMNSADPNVSGKAQSVYNDMLNKQVAVIMGSPQLLAAAGAGQPEAEGEDYSDLLSSADAIVSGQ